MYVQKTGQIFEHVRIPLNTTSRVRSRENISPRPPQWKTVEGNLFCASTWNVSLPSSLLLSFLLQCCEWFLASLPSNMEAACPPGCTMAYIPVEYPHKDRWGGVHRVRIGIIGITPSDCSSWITNWMSHRPQQCHLAQFHQASTDLHQAASMTSQTGITYPCPRNSLPHCQQHPQKILENKPCCSQEPESQHKLCTQPVTARRLLLTSWPDTRPEVTT